ncbi:MAG: PD-(D/E)XK nuclease family protein [candidate division Zixibacteria bacterium]|nr:PD-(D/E)XK nuclease family protein [candidate division Zixibacteria bacterium]
MPLYSYSRIGTFFNCPRQYKFKYLDKPPIEKISGVEAFMGSMSHEALEQCYHLVKVGKPPEMGELEAIFKRLWDDNLPDNLLIVKENMTAADYYAIGLKGLREYHARYFPFGQEITLGLERRVVFSLDGDGRYKLQGYIDRISRDSSGKIKIQDYKTSGNLPAQSEIDKEAQLALYQMAVNEMWPNNNGIELIWHFLQFDTPLVSQRSDEQLEELRSVYIHKIQQIEDAVELNNFPANETMLCSWCEYKDICPAKGGTGRVESEQTEIPLVSTEETTGLVDEYILLNAHKKEIMDRLDELKSVLTKYAESESSRFIDGSDDEGVSISISKIRKLPTKTANKKTYEEVTDMIKSSGLYDGYSSLNIRSLQKAFNELKLPREVQEFLKPRAELVMQSTVRIKKSKKNAG